MTSHAFQDWQDNNADLDIPWGTTECAQQRDAAINTLRDIVTLSEEDGNYAVHYLGRIGEIARSCLNRLGVPLPVDVEDLGGPSGLQFADETCDLSEEIQVDPPY
jgi:hypothetical protein